MNHPADPLFLDALERSLARDRANFRLALVLALAFVALIVFSSCTRRSSETARSSSACDRAPAIGLLGILFAPLLHADFAHVFGNAVPLVVLGTAMLYLYPQSARRRAARRVFRAGRWPCGWSAATRCTSARAGWCTACSRTCSSRGSCGAIAARSRRR